MLKELWPPELDPKLKRSRNRSHVKNLGSRFGHIDVICAGLGGVAGATELARELCGLEVQEGTFGQGLGARYGRPGRRQAAFRSRVVSRH